MRKEIVIAIFAAATAGLSLLMYHSLTQPVWARTNQILIQVYTDNSFGLFANITPLISFIWLFGLACIAIGFSLGYWWKK